MQTNRIHLVTLKLTYIENCTCYKASVCGIALRRSYSINLGCKLAESTGSEIFENAKAPMVPHPY